MRPVFKKVDVPYDIDEHCHRFAAWAASRAASVKGVRFKVHLGVATLESCGFGPSFQLSDLPTAEKVDEWHCKQRIRVKQRARKRGLTFTDGVAAKLINCYLKVRFVCGGHHNHELVKQIHPPIDEVLLKRLAEKNVGSHKSEWRKYRKTGWSKFNSENYQNVINFIRSSLPREEPLWKIEEYWKGHR